MVAIAWIDIFYEKGDTMLLQAYDFDGAFIFEKRIKGTLKDAEETINVFQKGMGMSAELYDYSK